MILILLYFGDICPEHTISHVCCVIKCFQIDFGILFNRGLNFFQTWFPTRCVWKFKMYEHFCKMLFRLNLWLHFHIEIMSLDSSANPQIEILSKVLPHLIYNFTFFLFFYFRSPCISVLQPECTNLHLLWPPGSCVWRDSVEEVSEGAAAKRQQGWRRGAPVKHACSRAPAVFDEWRG